jgi:hypothetical protein
MVSLIFPRTESDEKKGQFMFDKYCPLSLPMYSEYVRDFFVLIFLDYCDNGQVPALRPYFRTFVYCIP